MSNATKWWLTCRCSTDCKQTGNRTRLETHHPVRFALRLVRMRFAWICVLIAFVAMAIIAAMGRRSNSGFDAVAPTLPPAGHEARVTLVAVPRNAREARTVGANAARALRASGGAMRVVTAALLECESWLAQCEEGWDAEVGGTGAASDRRRYLHLLLHDDLGGVVAAAHSATATSDYVGVVSCCADLGFAWGWDASLSREAAAFHASVLSCTPGFVDDDPDLNKKNYFTPTTSSKHSKNSRRRRRKGSGDDNNDNDPLRRILARRLREGIQLPAPPAWLSVDESRCARGEELGIAERSFVLRPHQPHAAVFADPDWCFGARDAVLALLVDNDSSRSSSFATRVVRASLYAHAMGICVRIPTSAPWVALASQRARAVSPPSSSSSSPSSESSATPLDTARLASDEAWARRAEVRISGGDAPVVAEIGAVALIGVFADAEADELVARFGDLTSARVALRRLGKRSTWHPSPAALGSPVNEKDAGDGVEDERT